MAQAETDWLSVKPAPVRDWEYGYIDIPAFTDADAHGDMGASVILSQWNYIIGKSFQLLDLPVQEVADSVGLAVRERLSDGTVRRYKLTNNDLFTIQDPLYNGEVLGSNCVIEAWTLKGQVSVVNTTVKKLRTSIRRQPPVFNTVTDYEVNAGVQHSNQDEETARATLPDSANIASHYIKTPSNYALGAIAYLTDEAGDNDFTGNGEIVVDNTILKGRNFLNLAGGYDYMYVTNPANPAITLNAYLIAAALNIPATGISSGEYLFEITDGVGKDSSIRINLSGAQWQLIFAVNGSDIHTENISLPFTDVVGVGDVGIIVGNTVQSYVNTGGLNSVTKFYVGSNTIPLHTLLSTWAEIIIYTGQADSTNFADIRDYLRENSLGFIPLSFEFDTDLKFNANP